MAMCWSLAFLNLFQGMGAWGIATSAGLIMTGIAMDWQGELYKRITHMVGAVLAISAGLVGLFFVHGVYLPVLIFCIGIYPIYKATDDFVWWIEVMAVTLILIAYLWI